MQVIVRYRVKPDRAAENLRLVKAVFAELAQQKPDGLRYASFVADDGVTFYHVASIDADKNPLLECQAFKAFQKDIVDRCEDPPRPTQVNEVGSYNFHVRPTKP